MMQTLNSSGRHLRKIVHLDEKRGQWDCINDDEAEEEELDDGGIWLG